MSQRELTAYHEAGHAVACVMRGGRITSITIDPDPAEGKHGETWSHGMQHDESFVIYAGPWAETRSQWAADGLNDIRDTDDDGCTFDDRLTTCFIHNKADLASYEHYCDEIDRRWLPPQLQHSLDGREEIWSHELEQQWAVIHQVAQLLLLGQVVTTEMVRVLLDSAGETLS